MSEAPTRVQRYRLKTSQGGLDRPDSGLFADPCPGGHPLLRRGRAVWFSPRPCRPSAGRCKPDRQDTRRPPGQAFIEKKAPPIPPVQILKPRGLKASPNAAAGPSAARERRELRELRRLQQDVLGIGGSCRLPEPFRAGVWRVFGCGPAHKPALMRLCRRRRLVRPSYRPRQSARPRLRQPRQRPEPRLSNKS